MGALFVFIYEYVYKFARLSMLQMLISVIDNIFYMYNSNTSLKDSCKHYAQIIERIGPIRQHQAGHPRPVFVYQIQAGDTSPCGAG